MKKCSTRNSHRRCSIKKGVLKNFAKLTGKHLFQSLFFYKVAVLRSVTLFKKRLWHRCFPMNFAKFLRTAFLQNTSGRLLFQYNKNKISIDYRMVTWLIIFPPRITVFFHFFFWFSIFDFLDFSSQISVWTFCWGLFIYLYF